MPNGKKELTPKSCLLTSRCAHLCMSTHTRTGTSVYMRCYVHEHTEAYTYGQLYVSKSNSMLKGTFHLISVTLQNKIPVDEQWKGA